MPVVVNMHTGTIHPERDGSRSEGKAIAALINSVSKYVDKYAMKTPVYLNIPPELPTCPVGKEKVVPVSVVELEVEVCPPGSVLELVGWKLEKCFNHASHKPHSREPGHFRLWIGYGKERGPTLDPSVWKAKGTSGAGTSIKPPAASSSILALAVLP